MKDKMLLVGGSGFLGLNWQHYNTIYDISATYNSFLPSLKTNWIQFSYNGSNIDDLKKIIYAVNPKVIVNCAATTNIDLCESNRSLSQTVNTNFPKELAILANTISTKFIHISTDHYKSKINLPRKEIDELFPINVYGETKLEAEKLILEECPKALVIRVNFFGYGARRSPSLLDEILLNLSIGKKFYGFNDVFFTPVSIRELVVNVNKLIDKDLDGIFNIASSDVISKFEFAKKVCEIFEYNSDLIIESNSDFFKSRSKRPKYLALDATKSINLTGIMNLSTNDMLVELKRDIVWRQQVGEIYA
jgi:dTDP-4-dehydrorhamnose reductase